MHFRNLETDPGNGITGLFMNGPAGKGLMIGNEDRFKAAAAVLDTVKGRVPVMGNVIVNTIDDGCVHLRFAL